jgi:hypothetical protein
MRMATLVSELARCCSGDSAWQLFPNGGVADLMRLKDTIEGQSNSNLPCPSALREPTGVDAPSRVVNGRYTHLAVFGDRPHRGSNAAPRWYAHLSRAPPAHRPCPCPAAARSPSDGSRAEGAFDCGEAVGASASASAPSSAEAPTGCALFAPAGCLLCAVRGVARLGAVVEDTHWSWLEAEHGRFLNREARVRRREALTTSASSDSAFGH